MTSVTVWDDRSHELRALLNPAFLAVLAWHTAAGHERERHRPLPYALTFLALPLVLHGPTRDQLPRGVATRLTAWMNDFPAARLSVAPLAKSLVPSVQEGIRTGLRHDALELSADGIRASSMLRNSPRGLTGTDVPECRKRAEFVGRWFARAGDPVTVLAAWGLSV